MMASRVPHLPIQESTRTVGPVHPEYATVSKRLQTYYGGFFPDDCPIRPEMLARAGFFSTGSGDRVRCYYCDKHLSRWAPGDDAWEEHARHSPNCRFVQTVKGARYIQEVQAKYGQTAVLPTTPTEGPLDPQYASEMGRLRTFVNFPEHCPVRPNQLARAGFFFLGIGDSVSCFHCGKQLSRWEVRDDAWEEHARHSPNCAFLLSKKGAPYVLQVQLEYSRQQSQEAGQQNNPALNDPQPMWLEAQLNSEPATTVLRMGYPRTLVSRVLERRHDTHATPFTDVSGLLESLFQLEDYLETRPALLSTISSPSITTAATTTTTTSSSSSTASSSVITRTPSAPLVNYEDMPNVSDQVLLEEYRHLREQKLCKVCMENEVSIAFLPCGHLCCCSGCASAVGSCPICRGHIATKTKIFWA